MRITLTNAGKRFNRDWIFRHLSYEFVTGYSYAIIGPNGSGKSTLLQLIAGAIGVSEGTVRYELTDDSLQLTEVHLNQKVLSTVNRQLSSETVYRQISFSAPYLELIEEMTLKEFLEFHRIFKPFFSSLSIQQIMDLVLLKTAADKQIRYFSSGMKQRVKLAQAIFSDTPVILLDEPCTNLDVDGVALYQELMKSYCHDRLVIVGSNDVQEYGFCEERIDVTDYK
ncbi:MAG TPA: ATP-binding cassette domain-containing protein [Puia sp.]|nr:ATP-binding cassette domain-containing protein [Puia sp.]